MSDDNGAAVTIQEKPTARYLSKRKKAWAWLRAHMDAAFGIWAIAVLCFCITRETPASYERILHAGVCSAFLCVVALLDWKSGYIFDIVLLPMALVGLLWHLPPFTVSGLSDLCLRCGLGSGLFLLLRMTTGGLGGGDVKCMAALGCWFTWQEICLTILLAFWAGGLVAALILWKERMRGGQRRRSLPFGPFLSLAAYLVLLFGDRILTWYREALW